MADEPQRFERELVDEIDHGAQDYTDVELLEQAQLNAQAMLLGTVEILQGNPDVLTSWREGIASIFMRGWDTERDWSANAILDALLTNYRSFGARVIEQDDVVDPPTARLAGLPDPVLVNGLQLDPAHIQELLMIGAALAGHLGGVLDWTVEPDSGDIVLTVSEKGKTS